jgi:hypothetical protein
MIDPAYDTVAPGDGTRRKRRRQRHLWIFAADLPTTAAHPLFRRVNARLDEHRFDEFVEQTCRSFYAETSHPSRYGVARSRRDSAKRRSSPRGRTGCHASLLAVLATLKPLDEDFPRIESLRAEPVDL